MKLLNWLMTIFCKHRYYVANSSNRKQGDDFVLECLKCGKIKIGKELRLEVR